ncbi:MAG TPA: hypothetical protein VK712_03950 [Verrucomicrobiae bacterium]|jgi:hypothetical protein|nr:hypothetical protein [Verrucomicrobiae bacterium]
MRKSYERGAKIASILALSLGATACGGHRRSIPEATSPQTPNTQVEGGATITYNRNGSVTVTPSNYAYAAFREFCQGTMLVVETAAYPSGNTESSAPAIQPDSPYCADGRLTPSDFRLNPDAAK